MEVFQFLPSDISERPSSFELNSFVVPVQTLDENGENARLYQIVDWRIPVGRKQLSRG